LTRLRAEQLRIRLLLGRWKTFLSFLKCAEWLYGPLSLLLFGYCGGVGWGGWDALPGGKAAGALNWSLTSI